MRPLLIIKTGSALPAVLPVHGDFEAWIVDALGLPEGACRTVDVVAGEALPRPEEVAGVVVTGSPAMVTDRHPWSERTAAWLADSVAAATPTLGICFGHQLLSHALGGVVGTGPGGREIGTVAVQLAPEAAGDPLFGGMPRVLRVHATHIESVLEPPPCATVLAWNDTEPHHALRFAERAWGVQFHPEFRAAHMRGYIRARRRELAAEGLEPDRLLAAVSESADGGLLMGRFAALVCDAATVVPDLSAAHA